VDGDHPRRKKGPGAEEFAPDRFRGYERTNTNYKELAEAQALKA